MHYMSVEQIAGLGQIGKKNERGLNIYFLTQLMSAAARAKDGKLINAKYEFPYWSLSIDERIDIVKKCDIIFGIVSGRMNRIGALDWRVVCQKKDEDRIYKKLKDLYAIYKEYEGVYDFYYLSARSKAFLEMKKYLVDLLPDTSNFQKSIMRWKNRIKLINEDEATEIEDWLRQPNQYTNFTDFVKMVTFDLHTHGNYSVYKEYGEEEKITNFYNIVGGTVHPLKSVEAGGVEAYIQLIDGFEPKIYFGNELAFGRYLPATAQTYGLIPLEALVNKIAESMLFDRLAAERADGTKPPEKLVVFGSQSPFGDLNKDEFALPKPVEEQDRIETILNEERKNAVRTLTGVGTPLVLDISKADTFGNQSERQKDIREVAALVFAASNLELNLTGSGDTSGRATSESQERLDQQKGIYPIIRIIEDLFNSKIIPFRFGYGHSFEFVPSPNEMFDIRKAKEKIAGPYSMNEAREDLGLDPVEGEEFDKPGGGNKQGTDQNPLVTRQSDV